MGSVGKFGFAVAVVALVMLGTLGVAKNVTNVLVENGLPKVLLPATVKSYTLADNGKFEVNLSSTCTTELGGEEVHYKKTITGDVTYGMISNLVGIQVHEAFLWLSVTCIKVDNILPKTIWFKVGYFTKALSTDLFIEPPVCKSLWDDEEEEPQDHEAEEPQDDMTWSEWLSKALSGTLEANLHHVPDSEAARKLLE